MTGTLPNRTDAPAPPVAAPSTARVDASVLPSRERVAVRPWSALVCGLPDDRTLLVVDWLLLACRAAGFIAQAVPLESDDRSPHGMFVEVAGSADVEASLAGVPWGAVDLVVAGEHLELVRAIDAGFVDPEATTVVASCRRSFGAAERVVAPEHLLTEIEIDTLATASARAYFAFDGPEVARWYGLPAAAQPGLLFGAICGTGATGLDERVCAAAIAQLGIDPELHGAAFARGMRLGRRPGGRVRRVRTAYQFTRRRRALVDHVSRAGFEALVARAEELVDARHVPALQDAIFELVQFQDAAWAERLVEHVAELARAEREHAGEVAPEDSIIPDAIRSLAALHVWSDAAWIANRKRRRERIKELRAAHGVTRADEYELVEHVPMDDTGRHAARHPRVAGTAPTAPALLQRVVVERIRTTSLAGSWRLRRLAAAAERRPGSAQQQHELDTAELWLQAVHDALRSDHGLARIVARSGTIVQGGGAVRDATRQTAHAFWGRVVRQALAIDRSVPGGEPEVARLMIPFAWRELCTSGPLALWEHAAQVLAISMAHARGMSRADTLRAVEALCAPRRPLAGT